MDSVDIRFTDEVPSRDAVEAVLAAGASVPTPAAALGNIHDFRSLFVYPGGSAALQSTVSLLLEKGRPWPALGAALCLVVVVEHRGIPSIAEHSIDLCLHQMCLKATALGLGFQVVSAIALLAEEPRFWTLAGLPPDIYKASGCVLGILERNRR
jgi:hypothetical protein